MKILLVNTYHYHRGGDCTYNFSLAKLLEKKGHKVIHFAMKHPKNYKSEYEKYFVDYIDFRELNNKKTLKSAIKVIGRSFYSKQSREKIKQLIAYTKPDIAHIQNYLGHLTPSILTELKNNNIPIVQTLHDYKYICPNTHLLAHGKICERCKNKRYYNAVISRCKKESLAASLIASLDAYYRERLKIDNLIDMFISPSNFLKNKFVEFGWDDEKIKVVNNFLDDDNFSQENININNDKQYILYFGQIEKHKGIYTLIKAAGELKNIKLKLAGTGSEINSVKKFVESLGYNNIELLGYKSGNELKKIIVNSSFVIVPSEWYENYPYSIMEAMAVGKPIIAARIGGLPELVEDGVNGLLFKSGSVDELRIKIKLLWSNKSLREKMSVASFNIAKKEFSSDLYYEKIIKIYQQALCKG